MYTLASLLAGSAICISVGSTLCLDACMVDCPVISIGFDGDVELPYDQSARRGLDFTHIKKMLALGVYRWRGPLRTSKRTSMLISASRTWIRMGVPTQQRKSVAYKMAVPRHVSPPR